MISVEGLTVEFSGKPIFDDISFVVNKKDRIALVGKNGAGKSTLLKVFAGIQEPTKGIVSYPKDLTIGYLPQHMKLNEGNTVLEEASLAFDHIKEMEIELDRINNELANRMDYESDDYHKLIDKSTLLNEQYLMSGGGNFLAEIERTLIGLGFRRSDFNRHTKEFSGGWRMRIEIAKLLLRKPDVLLLDEPTNHLDIESIQWLETFLSTRANAVILVSHDRAFLDAVTIRTIEIVLGKTYDYRVNYSKYVELRKERREQQIRAYENQQKQIQETEDFIERFRYKASKAIQVQSRIKQLDKIERIEIDEEDNSTLRLKFSPAPRSGSYPVIIENVEKKYDNQLIFSNANLTIERGDKIAFVGKNGEGKSTLIKCIMGETDYTGKLELGHNVQIGYFAQNQATLLDENKTVFETIEYVATGDIRTRIRDILGAFMFGGEASDKRVKVLSGGERSRLAMIRLLLEPVNLLILDEPTNHLDMKSKDVLKEAIKDFDGTVIIVSHDREFLDGLVDKVYEFGNQKVVEHLCGIYEFLNKKKIESLSELENENVTSTNKEKNENNSSSQTTTQSLDITGKLSYEERKEFNKLVKRVEKLIGETEDKIEKLESEKKALEDILATPERASDNELFENHGKISKQIEEEMTKWEHATLELEELKNRNPDI